MDRAAEHRQRVDKWLYFARIVKSRSLAQAYIGGGHIKINGNAVHQASRLVTLEDRLELSFEHADSVLIVKGIADRRGPYSEARLLYEDVTPSKTGEQRLTHLHQALRKPGSGRPTKRERRAIAALRPSVADDSD
ncbi:RNA-binding S4 domain-containing protein [Ciceribacter sp. L1K22]|uniref:RNA-binding S4 domain-containing protein n=1 Tax=Ciceribacter sp. L1K22 TaxID=2820275 RepID=UPI001ABE8CC5|nr:RNA-binding S4 domain-containing protein [Ciceribacter sp. L1K22]MBO3761277.1 RNA-binding S4 domain-containing protein [Ciceribacter sp. L1K22]